MEANWVSIAIQAGGAIAVCAMFLWFLQKKSAEDKVKSAEFLTHLERKDDLHQKAVDKQMSYLRDRDKQATELANAGHQGLREISVQVSGLREQLSRG